MIVSIVKFGLLAHGKKTEAFMFALYCDHVYYNSIMILYNLILNLNFESKFRFERTQELDSLVLINMSGALDQNCMW